MKKLFIETYGCQMNVADSEVIAAILQQHRYVLCNQPEEADLILVNTCSIRDNAEQKIYSRSKELVSLKKKNHQLKIGILGCMAERLSESLFEKIKGIDVIAGPDSYKNLPDLLEQTENMQRASDVILSTVETYEDIDPLHYQTGKVTAFVSVMRGCNNFCSYCVVPYTRGRERSRPVSSILRETEHLVAAGFREITLLGQNVNSYAANEMGVQTDFPQLLNKIAVEFPSLRIRFATSHPKDLSIALIEVMAARENIARSLHLPVQSGSDTILKRMNRKYSVSDYLEKVKLLSSLIPDITLSTDIIAGFCGETEDDHRQTLELMEQVGYFTSFMFKYSHREGTAAARLADDVADDVKTRRLTEIINLQQTLSLRHNRADIGKKFSVLIEGQSKKSSAQLFGRSSGNKVVVFDAGSKSPGDFANVCIERCTTATLIGKLCNE